MENNYSFILEDNRERREMLDKPLITFWLWVGLYTISTIFDFIDLLSFLGNISIAMNLYMIYIQTNRVNGFIARKTEWYTNIVEFTNQHSEDSRNLRNLNRLTDPILFNTQIKRINLDTAMVLLGINSIFWIMITIVGEEQETALSFLFLLVAIFSVLSIVVYEYPMNAVWNKIQCFENEFDETLSEVWIDNGWIEKPIEFYIDSSKRRPFFLWIFYSIITLGIMMFVWTYKIYTDPDNMYEQFHDREDKILEVIEKIEQQKRTEIEN